MSGMRFLLACCLLASAIAAEPQLPARLANDGKYAAKMQSALADRPATQEPHELWAWLGTYLDACMDARDYRSAEIAARAMVALAPAHAPAHANLSVMLGKQGKYAEALQEAEIAVLLDPTRRMHAEAIACSWLHHLGRTQEALDRFRRIPVPLDPQEQALHAACKACFYASVGSPEPRFLSYVSRRFVEKGPMEPKAATTLSMISPA